MERSTRHLGLGAAVLLVASGVLLYAAAWERWWPACPRDGFESLDCQKLQDHLYDFQVPADPWVPVGDAAWLAGLSFLLLALALACVPTVMLGFRMPVLTLVS